MSRGGGRRQDLEIKEKMHESILYKHSRLQSIKKRAPIEIVGPEDCQEAGEQARNYEYLGDGAVAQPQIKSLRRPRVLSQLSEVRDHDYAMSPLTTTTSGKVGFRNKLKKTFKQIEQEASK